MQTRQLTNEAAQGYTWAQLVGELAGLEMPDRHAVQRRRPRQLRGQTAAGADQRPDGKIVTEEPEHQLEALLAQIEARYAPGALAVDHTDGLSVGFADWRFNIRMSNTEPLVRLNVESRGDKALMQAKTDELLALIRA